MTNNTPSGGDAVVLRVDGAIARITLNRPKSLNVLDEPMAAALSNALHAVERRSAVKVVVLDGAGRAFMGGGDLTVFRADLAHAPDTASRLIGLFHQSIRCIQRMPMPVIASIKGAVAGGGVGLALACDLIVASAEMKLIPAYGRIGTSPDGGTSWSFTQLLGARRAMEVMLLGEPIEALRALELGLVNRVVPVEELAGTTDAVAAQLASGPRLAIANAKRLVQLAQIGGMDSHLEAERAGFVAAAGTADFREGITAFFERRAPEFEA